MPLLVWCFIYVLIPYPFNRLCVFLRVNKPFLWLTILWIKPSLSKYLQALHWLKLILIFVPILISLLMTSNGVALSCFKTSKIRQSDLSKHIPKFQEPWIPVSLFFGRFWFYLHFYYLSCCRFVLMVVFHQHANDLCDICISLEKKRFIDLFLTPVSPVLSRFSNCATTISWHRLSQSTTIFLNFPINVWVY